MLELFGHQILQKLLAPVCLVIVIWESRQCFRLLFRFCRSGFTLPYSSANWMQATMIQTNLTCKIIPGIKAKETHIWQRYNLTTRSPHTNPLAARTATKPTWLATCKVCCKTHLVDICPCSFLGPNPEIPTWSTSSWCIEMAPNNRENSVTDTIIKRSV